MTDHLLLREVIEAGLPVFYEQQLDPEATQMAASAREREEFMAHWHNHVLGNERVIKKTIVFDGQVAGNMVSFEQFGEREVGYWLGKEFWGQGIARRVLAEFLNIEQTRPLYAHVAKHNIASRRVLEKCGFVEAGLVVGTIHEDGIDDTQLMIMELV
ncbi:MAG: GNAT family N-acetyltransferase [Chloroflexi bacterium]|nr:GNAT family N-acetyltransferase [Ardenticatenaceae bacterium]MBL1131588.1 N-acetyltransferase [Chloroflexota bacterium]NOG37699.1 GNAT family N-acetyltransferase [Chloroflexota bacterium]